MCLGDCYSAGDETFVFTGTFDGTGVSGTGAESEFGSSGETMNPGLWTVEITITQVSAGARSVTQVVGLTQQWLETATGTIGAFGFDPQVSPTWPLVLGPEYFRVCVCGQFQFATGGATLDWATSGGAYGEYDLEVTLTRVGDKCDPIPP